MKKKRNFNLNHCIPVPIFAARLVPVDKPPLTELVIT
jgi:hypothetical protein